MRRGTVCLLLAVGTLLAGCPAPTQYAIRRPDLDCGRATRVAYKTLFNMGYTIIGMVEPSVRRPGTIQGVKKTDDGRTVQGSVRINCDRESRNVRGHCNRLIRDWVAGRDLDEESLKQLPPAERDAIEAEIRAAVKVALGVEDGDAGEAESDSAARQDLGV